MGEGSTAEAPAWFVEVSPETIARLRRTPVYRPIRFVARRLRRGEAFLRAKGLIIGPLVPEQELFACQKRVIACLREHSHQWGDYLEFGVYQGHSLSLMFSALSEADLLDRVRLFGFDSFQGFPENAQQERNNPWEPGEDKAELAVAQRVLRRRGVDFGSVKLIPGFFDKTLTATLRDREKIVQASIVNFDCDLYSSTAEALAFVAPLVNEEAIFLFDDWGGEVVENQKRAFLEFLDANPSLHAQEMEKYSSDSRVFLISRGELVPVEQRLRRLA